MLNVFFYGWLFSIVNSLLYILFYKHKNMKIYIKKDEDDFH